jgi:hypothetical protein
MKRVILFPLIGMLMVAALLALMLAANLHTYYRLSKAALIC